MRRTNQNDLLLKLLAQAASGEGFHAPGRGMDFAFEALEAEDLIEPRSGVYRATRAGVRALEDRGCSPLPGGEVAVLFTDMEGSTRLIERLGEAEAYCLLQRHFALLRAAVAEHRGHEIKSLGDGLMVVFGAVRDGVACAAEMHARVSREDEALGLRIGIHAGEPVREAGDYFGTPVIIARRLCDTARPGQTLVSELVAQLVTERRFNSLGELALKGLSKRVRASALACDVPASRARVQSIAIAV